jgi:O-methyltransferase
MIRKEALSMGVRVVTRSPSFLRAANVSRRYRQHTMISPLGFVDNLMIAERWAPPGGEVVECGVWRGGMIRGLAEVLGRDRKYHLFDSFEGLPAAKSELDGQAAIDWQQNTGSRYYYDNCSADEAHAKALFEGSGYDVEFHRGWFDDTIPKYQPERPISVLRLDGDWYDSTMTCLRGLVPHLAPKALILVDDYLQWDGCSRALHDYLSQSQSTMRIYTSRFCSICYLISQ